MSTRLSEVSKDQTKNHLRGLLNNVVRFVECPITDREALLTLWNSKFPAELYDAYKNFGRYGLSLGGAAVTDKVRFATDIGGRTICALIEVDKTGPYNSARALAGVPQSAIGILPMLCKDKSIVRDITFTEGDGTKDVFKAIEMSPEYIVTMLGTDKGRELLEWMQMCADMRDGLIEANKTLTDIIDMAATAGQIKRMVPDLLQYLPERQRKAFEEQKRASTIPFEWAPYPKKRVDDMLLQISKGHLLANMGKPRNEEAQVEYIDHYTWARYGKWVD